MLPLSLETQVLTALAYDPLSNIRIFLLQKVLKLGNTTTLDKCFVSNQQKIILIFATSENNINHICELKYQITFTDKINFARRT